MKVKKLLFLILVILSVQELHAETFVLSPAGSKLNFKVQHLGKFTVDGQFNVFEALSEINTKTHTLEEAMATINVASVFTENKTRDRHLKSKDFFGSQNHPHIRFKSTAIIVTDNATLLRGDLTLKGFTQPIEIPFSLIPSHNQSLGNFYIATGNTTLNRMNFGITKHKRMVGRKVEIDLTLQLISD